MGLDYRYLLFFERGARLDVLERLAEMADSDPDRRTILVGPDGPVTLPFSGWLKTGQRISWDDTSPTWDFMTVLCFEPDEAIEYYLDRLPRSPRDDGGEDDNEDAHDEHGLAAIGYIYLTLHNDMSDWPSETGEDLVLFEFGTPGTSMSVLFTESESVRKGFTHLLETCSGVYGLLDMEDMADLFWWRGEEMADRLPTANVSLAEIERMVGRHR